MKVYVLMKEIYNSISNMDEYIIEGIYKTQELAQKNCDLEKNYIDEWEVIEEDETTKQ